jgi:transcriptional regulator with XRE-family HTH domain
MLREESHLTGLPSSSPLAAGDLAQEVRPPNVEGLHHSVWVSCPVPCGGHPSPKIRHKGCLLQSEVVYGVHDIRSKTRAVRRLGFCMTRAHPASERRIASPTVIDAHVGTRIRLRRMMLGLPMTQVAKELGISFQQLEKYERASGRISASKLYLIASALGATVDFFFAEIQLDPTDGRSVERSETAVIADLLMRDARGQHIGQLIASYWRIKDAKDLTQNNCFREVVA